MKVGDLVKLYGGPDWLHGILKPPKKTGIVVAPATGAHGDWGYHLSLIHI